MTELTPGDTGAPEAVSQSQANAADLAAPSPDAAPPALPQIPGGRVLDPAERLAAGGRVRLAPVPPLGSVILSPLEEGGQGIVIEEGGTEVDAETAERAHEAAMRAGFRLQEL
jgi:hypothetical protein